MRVAFTVKLNDFISSRLGVKRDHPCVHFGRRVVSVSSLVRPWVAAAGRWRWARRARGARGLSHKDYEGRLWSTTSRFCSDAGLRRSTNAA